MTKWRAVAAGLVFSSAAVIGFLHKWEEGPKRQLVVYADKLAHGLPTVCAGITRHVTATPIRVGDVWTEEQCLREESAAIEKLQNRLITCFTFIPPQTVFDTATSHGWNFGVGATCASAAMAAWNRGEWELGCRRIEFGDDGRRVWSFVRTGKTLSNGKPEYKFVQGLANRRADEHQMCRLGAHVELDERLI